MALAGGASLHKSKNKRVFDFILNAKRLNVFLMVFSGISLMLQACYENRNNTSELLEKVDSKRAPLDVNNRLRLWSQSA